MWSQHMQNFAKFHFKSISKNARNHPFGHNHNHIGTSNKLYGGQEAGFLPAGAINHNDLVAWTFIRLMLQIQAP